MRAESKSEPDRALNRTAQQQKPITGTKRKFGQAQTGWRDRATLGLGQHLLP